MITFPNAKINLGLQVVAKRPDGYHNLRSVFYPVGWSDVLEILPAANLRFDSTGIDIPGEASGNLCLKAYHLLKADFDLPPVHIHLHKVIPVGAGLGGGSSDGAFTLCMLNELHALGLRAEQLEAYARQLGSDCAFFIRNQPVYAFDKGDHFEAISLSLKEHFIVLVNPGIPIATAEAYAGVKPQLPTSDLKSALQGPIATWRETISNDFEPELIVQHPAIGEIKESLYRHGAQYASLTGSGSTVYGIFGQEKDLRDAFPGYATWQGPLG
ncbi:MAG: 4-(cytidine 5'-diphospho)-2-C-methyl-D-erythritol kinase [Ferruginibacter sp.]|nr:4-(cytidine 5'-diphospho)-2-C-methyl-D-erythritol kinase [Cytophagales bacterium]